MEASAAALGVPLAAEHRPGVLRYLQMVFNIAKPLMAVPLTPADECATVFQPVSPPPRGAAANEEASA